MKISPVKKQILLSIVFGLIILSTSLTILFVDFSQASEIDFSYYRQMNESENIGPSDGVKITFKPKDIPIYAYGSWEHARFSLVGQPAGYIDLPSIGLGVKKNIIDGLNLYLDAGWFWPLWYKNGMKIYDAAGDIGDRAQIYLNEKYAPLFGTQYFDYYKIDMSGNFGGTFGAEWNYNFSKAVSVSVGLSYRILSIPMGVEGKNNNNNFTWFRYEDLSFSGAGINLGFVWAF